MAATRYCPSCLSTASPTTLFRPVRAFAPPPALRSFHTSSPLAAVQSANAAKYKRKDQAQASKKKKKTSSNFDTPDLRDAQQFSLVDAMRYLRAAEVGRNPSSSKYELHVRFKTPKNGAVVRNRMRLPHPVKTDMRVCVIAPPDSAAGKAAKAAGASLVGEEQVFDMVREGRIEFERCLCHADSLPKLSKSGIARVLGPRGLMPSAKTNTVVKDVAASVKGMVGASEYRERLGVVRMAVGQLGFTPEEMQRNIKAFVDSLKKDIAQLSDRISKDIHEVVLSSTNGPGMSLNGEMRGPNSPPTKDLSVVG
ncbi:hypothetical protein WHR41_00048 [Cladosporium halotolerans]|uniref:Ribosomal protein L1 n=1 Tax=Cladosporium halotolerans TaxID=1052096 RepID=A0AB34L2Q9_9PEZI